METSYAKESAVTETVLEKKKTQQTAAPLIIDLDFVVKRVLGENLDVLIAQNRIQRSKGNLIQSYAPLLPSLQASNSYDRFRGGEIVFGSTPFHLDRKTFRPTVSANYSIQTGGKALFQIQSATKQLEQTRFQADQEKQKMLLDAVVHFYTWLRDQEQRKFMQQVLDETQAIVRFQESRLKAGFGTPLEVSQSQTLALEKEVQALATINQSKSTAFELQVLLNMTDQFEITPDETTPFAPMKIWPEEASLEAQALFDLASKNRPDVKSLLAQIAVTRAQKRMAIADLFPTISLSAYNRGIGPDYSNLKHSSDIYAAITVDLLRNMGVGYLGSIKAAVANQKDSELGYDKQLQEIHKSILKAAFDLNTYRQQYQVDQKRLMTATETYKMAKARLRTGFGNNLDLIKANETLLDAQKNLLDTVLNLNKTQLRLLYETGQLTPDAVLAAKPGELPQYYQSNGDFSLAVKKVNP